MAQTTALTKDIETPYTKTNADSQSALETQSFLNTNKKVSSTKKRKYILATLIIVIIIGAAVGIILYLVLSEEEETKQNWPIVAATWPWKGVIEAAWSSMIENDDSLYAVQIGCEWCENNPGPYNVGCDWSVGYGGSPDETGEVRLDAMIMYGPTHNAGAVASMRNVKNAIGVARYVMHYTTHTMLVGQSATDFAQQMGFPLEDLNGSIAWEQHTDYLNNNCQPNSRKNVINASLCPPYTPIPFNYSDQIDMNDVQMDIDNEEYRERQWNQGDHDTIGVIGIDSNGYMSVGTSTNGGTNKVPGRVGDSPIIGGGGYVEQGVGAAVGTGDGDIMMRFVPTHAAVFYMKQGMNVGDACRTAMDDIVEYYPAVYASLVCMDANGNLGGATAGVNFTYTYRDRSVNEATWVRIINPY